MVAVDVGRPQRSGLRPPAPEATRNSTSGLQCSVTPPGTWRSPLVTDRSCPSSRCGASGDPRRGWREGLLDRGVQRRGQERACWRSSCPSFRPRPYPGSTSRCVHASGPSAGSHRARIDVLRVRPVVASVDFPRPVRCSMWCSIHCSPSWSTVRIGAQGRQRFTAPNVSTSPLNFVAVARSSKLVDVCCRRGGRGPGRTGCRSCACRSQRCHAGTIDPNVDQMLMGKEPGQGLYP